MLEACTTTGEYTHSLDNYYLLAQDQQIIALGNSLTAHIISRPTKHLRKKLQNTDLQVTFAAYLPT